MSFSHRTKHCEECGGSGWRGSMTGSGWHEIRCFDCSGSGNWDVLCDECGSDDPTNEDGICERCADAGDMSIAEFNAKYPERLVPVERKKLGCNWNRVAA